MNFPELISLLRSNHFYPSEVKVVGKEIKTIALEINCPSILAENRLSVVRGILPEGYSANFINNRDIIMIEKAK